MYRLLFISLISLMAVGCDVQPVQKTSDQKQNDQQETINKQAVEEVGLPNIVNFAEKRQLKDIYELRDKAITTYTYTQDNNGINHLLCRSVNYGIPYSTQYTNPMQPAMHTYSQDNLQHYGGYAVPQADPNGLYSPASAEGTWIFCLDPNTKKPAPLYVEPRVIVSPFKLPSK